MAAAPNAMFLRVGPPNVYYHNLLEKKGRKNASAREKTPAKEERGIYVMGHRQH
jgi:hypothetical protein